MKTIPVSVCASVRPNKSHQTHSNRAKEVAFHVFRSNFACRPSILILKILAESSEHADSESISSSSNFRFWRIQKQLTLSNRHNTIVLVGKNDVARLFFIIIWISRPVSLVRFPSFQDLPLDGRSVVYSAVGRGQQRRLDGESETYFSKCFFLYNFFKFWYNW
jgi:hypothetical protein